MVPTKIRKYPVISINWIVLLIYVIGIFVFFIDKDGGAQTNIGIWSVYPLIFTSMLLYIYVLVNYINFDKQLSILYLSFFILFMYYFLYGLILGDKNGISYSSQILYILTIIFFFSLIKWDRYIYTLFCILISLPSLFMFIKWFLGDREFPYSGIFLNSNKLGIYSFVFFVFLLDYVINSKNRILKIVFLVFILCNIVLMIVSDSRSIWICLLVFFSLILMYKKFKPSYIVHKLNFFLIVFFIFIYTIIYPRLVNTTIGQKIDFFSQKYFDKPFFSGREVLWNDLIEVVKHKIIFGLGSGVTPKEILGVDLSSHNTYLQVLLQTGALGVMLFLFLLYKIWVYLYIKENKTNIQLGFCAALIVYLCFEVSFIQNSFSLGLLQSMILGLGLNRSYKIRNNLVNKSLKN